MRSFVVALCLVACLAGSASARPFRRSTSSRPTQNYTQPAQTRVEAYVTDSVGHSSVGGGTSSAQGVAEMQAQANSCRHFGGNDGYEGVGYSSVSADDAIRHCCYWGQRKPRDVGVARGRNGWYACVRYY
jgi:hypothetical protein